MRERPHARHRRKTLSRLRGRCRVDREAIQRRRGECRLRRRTSPIVRRVAARHGLPLPPQAGEGPPRRRTRTIRVANPRHIKALTPPNPLLPTTPENHAILSPAKLQDQGRHGACSEEMQIGIWRFGALSPCFYDRLMCQPRPDATLQTLVFPPGSETGVRG